MISKRIGIAIAVLSWAFFAGHTARANETLYLKNGDKLSGEIVYYNPDRVDIKTGYGFFQIPVSDIGGVESLDYKMRDIILGQAAAPQPMLLDVPQGEAIPVAAATPAIEEIAEEPAEEEPGLWKAHWSGNANLGAGLRTGNSETSSINADANIKARWEHHRGQVKADFNREKDEGEITVDNRSIELTHDYFFREKWFIENSGRFEQDDVDKLDLRMILSTGLGYQPYERDDLNLRFVLGPGYLDEEFEDGSGDNSITAQWSMDYDQKLYKDFLRVFHEHDLTAPTEDFEAYLFQSESGIRIPIREGIIASGQIDFDWDNDPAAGTVEDDTTYAVKLGYEW